MEVNRWFRLEHPRHIRAVRCAASELAVELGFAPERQDEIAVATGELASNLVLHAGGGEMILQRVVEWPGVEVLSIDRGPGIRDVGRALAGGFSTARSLGQGLRVVRDLACDFDVHSREGEGTVVMARFCRDDPFAPPPGPILGLVAPPLPGGDVLAPIPLAGGGESWRLALADAREWGSRTVEPGHDVHAAALVELRPGVGSCSCGPGLHLEVWDGAGPVPLEDEPAREDPWRRIRFSWQGREVLVVSSSRSTLLALRERPELLQHHPSVIAGVLFREAGAEEPGLALVARGGPRA